MKRSEVERVALLRGHFGGSDPRVSVGIGDDAAVLSAVSGSLVWTVDAQVEGTHFRADWVSWEDVGWRSFMAAASDLAAMGADPIAALSALALEEGFDDEALDALARGQAAAAALVGAPVVGGNLARGEQTSVTTTLLGRASAPILREGARAGDGIYVVGPLGFAAAGLAALASQVDEPALAPCIAAWRRPEARIEQGRAMRGSATAAVDVSDGLARDAAHLAEASGVSVVFDEAALLAHAGEVLAHAAPLVGRAVLDLVLHGGEDYALVATSAVPLPGWSRIGTVVPRSEASLVSLETRGVRAPISPRGFDHFG